MKTAYRVFLTIAITGFIGGVPLGAESIPAPFQRALQAVAEAPATDSELPILSGTEGFDVEAYRSRFGEPGSVRFPEFQTAQAVVDGLAGASTGAARLASFEIGFATLEYNWFVATVAGDPELAKMLSAEIAALRQLHQTVIAVLVYPSDVSPFASLFYTRPEAGQLAMLLRRMASSAAFEQHLPRALDPEGYLGARMRAVHSRLTNSADLILAAAEAFAIYY